MSALQGQSAVVTGGSKGIGLAIAHALAGGGADVVLVARNRADLDAAVAEVGAAATGAVSGVAADVSSAQGVERLFAELRESTPRLNIFVANAGTGSYIPFLEISAAQWDEIVGLNLTGTFHCVQQAARMMLDHEHVNRVILVVSSIRSEGARPGVSAYAASKAGVNQLARVAAYELAPHGVRVNVLSPGMTVTPLVLINTPEVHEKAKALVPMGRPGLPEDMAAAAAYFCSPAAGFVTGANLVVDGGEGLW
jgi:NAD(P)-dependent dehydrogenase (short-subunit alcohol dehydrogenase family)